ncbi:MAG: guanylate kinase [Saprospiraceae bacterium]|nr:guanylate kinase [Saprospiraceae bacterium]HRG68003.1 guanylate kinase [Saprospiraceae bacterium]
MISKLAGKIIILTAPSGSGKTTIAKYLLHQFQELSFSVSATTRNPRSDEKNGVNYYFYSQQEFQNAIQNQSFLEFQEVYPGQYYGTLLSEVERIWSLNKIALFDIDVKGAHVIESNFKENILSIYVKASSLETLKQRLILRGTETAESLEKRLVKALDELEYAKYFDYVISNDELDLAQSLIKQIVTNFIASPLK